MSDYETVYESEELQRLEGEVMAASDELRGAIQARAGKSNGANTLRTTMEGGQSLWTGQDATGVEMALTKFALTAEHVVTESPVLLFRNCNWGKLDFGPLGVRVEVLGSEFLVWVCASESYSMCAKYKKNHPEECAHSPVVFVVHEGVPLIPTGTINPSGSTEREVLLPPLPLAKYIPRDHLQDGCFFEREVEVNKKRLIVSGIIDVMPANSTK